MMARKWILFLGAIFFISSGLAAQNLTVKGFADENVEIRDILLEFPRTGKNTLKATLVNRRQEPRSFAVDIRTEGVSLGMANYQSYYGFQVPGGQSMSIEVPYELNAPAISRMIIRLGTIPEPFDREAWNTQSAAWQDEHPLPKPEYFWREIVTFDVAEQYRQSRDNAVDDHEILLSRIRKDDLPEIKKKILGLIKSRKGDDRRDELRRAFYSGREYPASFDQRAGTWEGTYDYDAYIGDNDHFLSLFSISAEAGNRISGFFVTRRDNAGKKRPLIVFLGGNPGGTKEVLVRRIFPLTLAGYHVLCVERRASSRKLDSLDKFRSNIADPVTDVIRTLDFIEQEYAGWISSIGIFGISQGAQEAKFIAALDDRIEAMVSVVGTTSNEALFRDKERWIPTLSGLLSFPPSDCPLLI
ncbi:MAG: hypothetical protein JW843_11025 [Candidatus Aminicenantes bacterium]|nr:hypothetical protein [Candidatus Aminicenantes bacterium]